MSQSVSVVLISIHAPRAGSDSAFISLTTSRRIFQSTLPVRGATIFIFSFLSFYFQFQSTLPVRGATGFAVPFEKYLTNFNPRSPCGERQSKNIREKIPISISIHAPRAGSDRIEANAPKIPVIFQSTLPVRGATTCFHGSVYATDIISIHAPRAGSDNSYFFSPPAVYHFNPRSPCGERRRAPASRHRAKDISIHAPRAGSDQAERQKPRQK